MYYLEVVFHIGLRLFHVVWNRNDGGSTPMKLVLRLNIPDDIVHHCAVDRL